MRILVNYDPKESNFLPVLQYYIRQVGLQAVATSSSLSISELLEKAKVANCQAIFLVNEDTLKNCVPGSAPTLDAYRGSVLRFSIPVIVGNSLAHTQTVDHGKWLLEIDLKKFLTLSIPREEFTFSVVDDAQGWREAYEFLYYCVLISYDIETKTYNEIDDSIQDIHEGGETLITCCSWTGINSKGVIKTFVLPLIDFDVDHYSLDSDYINAIAFLRSVNSLPIPKVMHNGMYDSIHSIVYHAEPCNWTLDTMAMAHAEFSSLPKSLDFVASITLHDYVQWGQEASEASKQKDIRKYWTYNAKDTWYTLRICLHYLKNLPQYARINYSQQFKLVYPSIYCSFEGFRINQDTRKRLKQEALDKLVPALNTLRIMVADPAFNPASPKQVQHYIYDIFGASDPHIGSKKKGGAKIKNTRATDEKNLKAIGGQHPILLRFTSALLDYREAAKAVSTYFDFLQKNSRMLYSLNPFGTDTGRMSCSSSSFWCGTQVQNIPSYAKAMLEADEDFELVEPDNSQSEARCTAYLAQDLKLIAALEDTEKDFYKTLGTLFFAIPYEEVTKEFRNAVLKKIVHGTNYMMGAVTFIETAGIENLLFAARTLGKRVTLAAKPALGEITLKAFATSLLEVYHIPFNRVREWYKEVALEIGTTRMLKSPLGNTRYFFGDVTKNHNMMRSAVAHGPQNLSVAIINIGLWKIWNLVKQYPTEIRLKAQIHDSVFFQVKKIRPDIKYLAIDLMRNPVEVHGRILRIPVDMKQGDNWGSMKAS